MTDRYFEDYVPGLRVELGPIQVTEAEVLDFAGRFDPQPFHVDAEAAARSQYGGIIASGWHTCALMMRLMVTEGWLSPGSSLGSPGIDELRWLLPVRPGDTLRVRATVLDARRSKSKPDRGIVHTRLEVSNQDDAVAMSLVAINLVRARNAA